MTLHPTRTPFTKGRLALVGGSTAVLFATSASVVVAQKPPATNGVTIAAAPATTTYGGPTTISGQVGGTDTGGVDVTLEENPFPFEDGDFKPAQSKATTNATGGYSMAVTPTVNTRYRVTAKTKPQATSPETTVSVRVKVTLAAGERTGRRVQFSGTVTPAHDGKMARLQRRTKSGWKTVGRATLVAGTPAGDVATSTFAKKLKVTRTGTYRARVSPGDGDHVRGTSVQRRVVSG